MTKIMFFGGCAVLTESSAQSLIQIDRDNRAGLFRTFRNLIVPKKHQKAKIFGDSKRVIYSNTKKSNIFSVSLACFVQNNFKFDIHR